MRTQNVRYINNLACTIAQQLRISKDMGGITAQAGRQIFDRYGREIYNLLILRFSPEAMGRIVSYGHGPKDEREPEEIAVCEAIPQPLFTGMSGTQILAEMASRVIAVKISEVLWKASLCRADVARMGEDIVFREGIRGGE